MALWITLNIVGVETWQEAYKAERGASAITTEQRKEHADDRAWLVRTKQSDNFDAAITAALYYIDPQDVLLACKVPDAAKDPSFWASHNDVERLITCSGRSACAELTYALRSMRQSCMALALNGYATASHIIDLPAGPAPLPPAIPVIPAP
ncbi:MAG: hypothetical protein EXR69_00565 [Myxococcales bacterium]|nr:hypothetical protein [Myxococcales bacterium]